MVTKVCGMLLPRSNSPFRGKFKFESGTKLIIPTDLSEFFTELNILNSRFESSDNRSKTSLK